MHNTADDSKTKKLAYRAFLDFFDFFADYQRVDMMGNGLDVSLHLA